MASDFDKYIGLFKKTALAIFYLFDMGCHQYKYV